MNKNWYSLALERFAVIRMVSVPKAEAENGCPNDMIKCSAEALS